MSRPATPGVTVNMGARKEGTSRKHGSSAQSPSLYPWLLLFALTCAVYFLLWIPEDQPSAFSALVKCLPILCLVLMVRASASLDARTPFSAALLCSAVGDICLIWPSAFLYGLGAFAVAHLLYIWTLGFTLLRLRLLLPIALFSAPYAILLLRSLPADMVLPVVVYALVLTCTLWRGLARGGAAGWGSLLFTVSDSVLAWSTFVGPLPHSRLVIMTTYYAAQLLLALSGVRGARPKAS